MSPVLHKNGASQVGIMHLGAHILYTDTCIVDIFGASSFLPCCFSAVESIREGGGSMPCSLSQSQEVLPTPHLDPEKITAPSAFVGGVGYLAYYAYLSCFGKSAKFRVVTSSTENCTSQELIAPRFRFLAHGFRGLRFEDPEPAVSRPRA